MQTPEDTPPAAPDEPDALEELEGADTLPAAQRAEAALEDEPLPAPAQETGRLSLAMLAWIPLATSWGWLVLPAVLTLWTPVALGLAAATFPAFLAASAFRPAEAAVLSLGVGACYASPLMALGVPLGMVAGSGLGMLVHMMVLSAGARLMGLDFVPLRAAAVMAGGAGSTMALQMLGGAFALAALLAMYGVVLSMSVTSLGRTAVAGHLAALVVLGFAGMLAVLWVAIAPALVSVPAAALSAAQAVRPPPPE